MPKPSQFTPTNCEFFKSNLLMQLLHIRLNRRLELYPPNHDIMLVANLVKIIKRHGPDGSCVQHGATTFELRNILLNLSLSGSARVPGS